MLKIFNRYNVIFGHLKDQFFGNCHSTLKVSLSNNQCENLFHVPQLIPKLSFDSLIAIRHVKNSVADLIVIGDNSKVLFA